MSGQKRQIVYDTETTGLSVKNGQDRIIEFAGVEIVDGVITGKHLHFYCNPEGKASDAKAFAVHGISDDFLKTQPLFSEQLPQLLDFISGAEIIAHNGSTFDELALNMEMQKAKHPVTLWEVVSKATDSLKISKQVNGDKTKRHSLDVLCDVFGVDRSNRTLHGALIDCELLAEVYLKMTANMPELRNLEEDEPRAPVQYLKLSNKFEPLFVNIKANDLEAHEKYLLGIEKETGKPALERELANKPSSLKM